MLLRKLMLPLQGLLLTALLAVCVAGWLQQRALQQHLEVETDFLLDVPAGSTPGGVLARMAAAGQLQGDFWLRLYWRFNLADESLHSGEYRLQPQMTARQLLDLWRRGDVVQYRLTLVEGWNFRQLRQALARHDKLEQTLTELDDEALMARLGYAGQHPEGRFFPDTYSFVKGMTDQALLQRAYQRLDTVLQEEWQQRAEGLPYKDAYQALIMASIIEKETGVPEERGQIAGVFVRRLQKGMLLQTDPTVIYGMGERYRGRITRSHLREATAYNTYVISGLPPTPIAMVGREAIHAALHPVAGRSLFFVARGDGSHVFSETLAEHNRAVREYQLKRRADYRSSPAPRPAPDKEQP